MKLSVLDQSPIPAGRDAAQAVQNSIELARLADDLGYTRYWVAEHHATGCVASPSPEILIARVGAETEHIRVGSGGVMLPHYSALKVAESFRMLHALYPDRIDLGVGRAPGCSPLETLALRRERSDSPPRDDFGEQVVELLGFLHQEFAARHPFARIKVLPDLSGSPSVWVLGSSVSSAALAAELGLPYAFATFIAPEPARAAIAQYRAKFKPSRYLDEPYAMVAIGAMCAETDSEAERHFAPWRAMTLRIRQSRGDLHEVGPVPSPEDALAELRAANLPQQTDSAEWPQAYFGSPATLHRQLSEFTGALQADELMIVTVTHDHHARLRSYELLADVFELPASPL